jgi:hypothetical protein
MISLEEGLFGLCKRSVATDGAFKRSAVNRNFNRVDLSNSQGRGIGSLLAAGLKDMGMKAYATEASLSPWMLTVAVFVFRKESEGFYLSLKFSSG